MLELGDRLKSWQPISKAFFILLFVQHSENFQKRSVRTLWFCFLPSSQEESLHTLLKRQQ